MSRLRRLLPTTIRGQMIFVILIAVVAVVNLGGVSEPLRNALFSFEDTEQIADRASMLAQLLTDSTPPERESLLKKASGTGLDLLLLDPSALRSLISSSPDTSFLNRWTTFFFPPDEEIPLGGQWVALGGRRALALPVDTQSVLVVRNLPDIFATDDFVSPLTYYVLSFLTLLFLFSFYAARAVTKPIRRIIHELDRTDGLAEERHIPEKGPVEVVKLARALNEMRERIRGMVDMRMRMLRSVSHDLRTPLTRLRLRVERFHEERSRQAMLADIDRIDALVAGTLDYLKVDALGEAEEQADLSSILQTIQADFADVGFDVRYDGPNRLVSFCRPNSLARAVTNLCDNAVKFGSSVVISLDRSDLEIQIEVADDGPGIPKESHALVMEPFFKLDTARTINGTQGFGLGLSIVADIMKAHAGTVEFENRRPKGFVARLRLPTR